MLLENDSAALKRLGMSVANGTGSNVNFWGFVQLIDVARY